MSGRRVATINKMPNPNISNDTPTALMFDWPVTGSSPEPAEAAGTVGGAWATMTEVPGAPLEFGDVTTTDATVTIVATGVADGSPDGGVVAVGAVVTGTEPAVTAVVGVAVGDVSAGAEDAGAAVAAEAHTGIELVPVSKLHPFAPVGSSNADTLTRQVCATVGSPKENDALVDAPKAVFARSAPSIHTLTVFTPPAP